MANLARAAGEKGYSVGEFLVGDRIA